MGKKRTPAVPTISGDGFKGSAELSVEDLRKLTVEGFGKESLTNITTDWSGEIAGLVGLTLSPDNGRVIDGRFLLIGSLCRDKRVGAGKFWRLGGQNQPEAEPLTFSFTIDDCEILKFPNGGLTSEIIDGDAVKHDFYRGNVLVQKDSMPDSYMGFSLRAYITPTRETYAKITLILYPLAKDMLTATHPMSEYLAFPGLTLFAGEFPLIPKSSAPPLSKSWGCPFAPAIIPGTDWNDSSSCPRTPLLRAAVAQIMRKALRPEAKANHPALLQRWEEISEHGTSSLKDLQLDQIWPLYTRNEEFSEGKNPFSCIT